MTPKTFLEVCFTIDIEKAEILLAELEYLGVNGILEQTEKTPAEQGTNNNAAATTTDYKADYKAYWEKVPTKFADLKDPTGSFRGYLNTFFAQYNTEKLQFNQILEENWNQKWRQDLNPIAIGQHFYLCPPWEQKSDSKWNLVINPSSAFGTGYHATTQLMVMALEKHHHLANKSVPALDYGAGSGILTVALSYLGWEKIVAIDIDPICEQEVFDNMRLSGKEPTKVSFITSSSMPANQTYSCIAANLTTDILLQEKNWFSQAKRLLVFSGIYDNEWQTIEPWLKQHTQILDHQTLDSWHLFVCWTEG